MATNKEQLRLQSNENWFAFRKQIKPNALTGIAEGDSWFDYLPAWIKDEALGGDPFLGDAINQLNKFSNLNLLRIAKAGDTLENMTFGNDLDSEVGSSISQLDNTVRLIRKHQPDFLLFSGGGNDIAGENGSKFESFLNHAKSGLPPLRQSYFDTVINEVFPEMFIYLIKQVKNADPNIKIFFHNYGYPIPDGRAVVRIPGLDFNFIGPWFKPALLRKGLSQNQGQEIVNKLIDGLHDIFANLEIQFSGTVHYIDLRHVVQSGDWANELHLSALGYQKVAKAIEQKISQAFSRDTRFNVNQSINIDENFNLSADL